jgi:hypothetical protein
LHLIVKLAKFPTKTHPRETFFSFCSDQQQLVPFSFSLRNNRNSRK